MPTRIAALDAALRRREQLVEAHQVVACPRDARADVDERNGDGAGKREIAQRNQTHEQPREAQGAAVADAIGELAPDRQRDDAPHDHAARRDSEGQVAELKIAQVPNGEERRRHRRRALHQRVRERERAKIAGGIRAKGWGLPRPLGGGLVLAFQHLKRQGAKAGGAHENGGEESPRRVLRRIAGRQDACHHGARKVYHREDATAPSEVARAHLGVHQVAHPRDPRGGRDVRQTGPPRRSSRHKPRPRTAAQ